MEIIYAMIDGDGIVKNTIVVGVDWDLGGVPCGEYAVVKGDEEAQQAYINACLAVKERFPK